jgi:hypothetical protein
MSEKDENRFSRCVAEYREEKRQQECMRQELRDQPIHENRLMQFVHEERSPRHTSIDQDNRLARFVQEERSRHNSIDQDNRLARFVQEERSPRHTSIDQDNRFLRCATEERSPRSYGSYPSYSPGSTRWEGRPRQLSSVSDDRWLPPPALASVASMSSPVVARKRPEKLNIDSPEQFPVLSLGSSVGSPGTPRTPLLSSNAKPAPLTEEVEYIPLPKKETGSVRISIVPNKGIVTEKIYEDEQEYKTVKKISGGTWAERVKYFSNTTTSEEEPQEEQFEYDEDGFPRLLTKV